MRVFRNNHKRLNNLELIETDLGFLASDVKNGDGIINEGIHSDEQRLISNQFIKHLYRIKNNQNKVIQQIAIIEFVSDLYLRDLNITYYYLDENNQIYQNNYDVYI